MCRQQWERSHRLWTVCGIGGDVFVGRVFVVGGDVRCWWGPPSMFFLGGGGGGVQC